jgi:pentatricopeptide repeat protein
MLVDSGKFQDARRAFEAVEPKIPSSWDALLNKFVRYGEPSHAFDLYHTMVEKSYNPSAFTFVALLKACGKLKDVTKGSEVHSHIAKLEWLKTNLFVWNSVVDMYAKCGSLSRARELFEGLQVRDAVSWNALIAGYVQHEHAEEALNFLERMKREGVAPDAVTLACGLKAAGNIRAANLGRQFHSEVARRGLLQGDVVLGGTLVDMYIKCGLLEEAKEVFDELPVRDVITWTALISGYAQHERGEEALGYFEEMQGSGFSPNAMTFASSLKACGSAGAADMGRKLHLEILRKGLLRMDLILGTALVDMYAKCGMLKNAQDAFDNLPYRDLVLWNSLISGYAQVGEIGDVLGTLEEMRVEGRQPDEATFVSVLNACSHAGLVDSGQAYFIAMNEDYGIAPIAEHHMCMVDLFGRAGQLKGALRLLNIAPCHPNVMLWLTVLGACKKWGDVDLGRTAFHQAIWLGEKEAATYICAYNMFADAELA